MRQSQRETEEERKKAGQTPEHLLQDFSQAWGKYRTSSSSLFGGTVCFSPCVRLVASPSAIEKGRQVLLQEGLLPSSKTSVSSGLKEREGVSLPEGGDLKGQKAMASVR